MARRRRSVPAHPHLFLPHLIVPLRGSIAAICFRPRLQLDWDFATNTGRLEQAERAARELLVRYPEVHDGNDRSTRKVDPR